MTASLLPRMAPKNATLEMRMDGTPGGGITPSDIAHALGQVTKHDYPSLLLRAKYLLDVDAARAFERRLRGYLLVQSAVEGWGMDTRMAATFAHVLMLDHISPTFCRTCSGNGGVMAGEQWVRCWTCAGSGRENRNDISSSLNVADWEKWKGRVRKIQGKLSAWETEGLIWVATLKSS